jgi:hypothetical protein
VQRNNWSHKVGNDAPECKAASKQIYIYMTLTLVHKKKNDINTNNLENKKYIQLSSWINGMRGHLSHCANCTGVCWRRKQHERKFGSDNRHELLTRVEWLVGWLGGWLKGEKKKVESKLTVINKGGGERKGREKKCRWENVIRIM